MICERVGEHLYFPQSTACPGNVCGDSRINYDTDFFYSNRINIIIRCIGISRRKIRRNRRVYACIIFEAADEELGIRGIGVKIFGECYPVHLV